MFKDRTDAGRKLAARLSLFGSEAPVIVALPRGGVPVAFEVARALHAPLDVLIVRKLGYPDQPDFAIGALVGGDRPEILLNTDLYDEAALPAGYLESEIAAKLAEIHVMEDKFREHRKGVSLTGRMVIVVDDGIATGATMRVVIQRIRRDKPDEIVVAAPVASREAFELLGREADETVCLDVPEKFRAVSEFYRVFQTVPSREVAHLLHQARTFETTPFAPGVSHR